MDEHEHDRESLPSIVRNRFDAVIFDLDGVITRTAEVHASAWKQLFDDYLEQRAEGAEFDPFDIVEDYGRYVDGKPRYEGVRSFLEARGIELDFGHPSDPPDAETICGLGNRKNELFHETLKKKGVSVYESSVKLVVGLRQRGFATAVVSSSKNCAAILEAAEIVDLFDVRVDGVDAQAHDLEGKPAADTFLEATTRLGLDPERSVVFEDAVSGVEAGVRGGFGLVVGVDRGQRPGALRQAGAHVVVSDLGEIPLDARRDDLGDALEAIEPIASRLSGKRSVVLLDYDGTLTPIVARPDDAVLSDSMRETIEALAAHCQVGIISGRGLEDVRERVGIDALFYAGSHGFEIRRPDGTTRENEEAAGHLDELEAVAGALAERLAPIDGAQLERKRFSLAIHYRNVDPDRVAEVDAAVDAALSGVDGLRHSTGKKIHEIQPDVDWHKGRALEWILDELGLEDAHVHTLYLGDDVTDEDAFRALLRRGIGICVGGGRERTAAAYRLDDPAAVERFLEELAAVLVEQSAWRLSYDDFVPAEEGLREALCTLGNGYFATRGAAPESHADEVHYPGTYLAGGYNRLKTAIAGRTIENEDLVNLPNWLSLEFRLGNQDWFDLRKSDVTSFTQELDIERGLLHRHIQVKDDEGRETRISQRRLVSMAEMHTAALETTISPRNWSGTIELRSALDGRVTNDGVERYQALNDRHLEPASEDAGDGVLRLEVVTSQSRLAIAQAAVHDVLVDGKVRDVDWAYESEPGYVAANLVLEVEAGEKVTLDKRIGMYTSRDHAITECGDESAQLARRAPRFETLAQEHSLAWQRLWRRFQIQLQLDEEADDREAQRILNLYSFHLLQSASMHSLDIDVGMPSRGWHGEAYRGHIFWDELIIFPFLNYRVPQITRALLMYRYRRLGRARDAARAAGHHGAMYPWQSGSNGREESQTLHLNPKSGRWLPDNTHLQRHINSAIAYNVCQYFEVSNDLEFLSDYGAEMVFEIARFWSSIAHYDPSLDRFTIRGVMGPDEFHEAYPGSDRPGLDDNAYTNVMAVYVLRHALQLFDVLPSQVCRDLCARIGINGAERRRWEAIVRKMRLVISDEGILQQFDGYDALEELDWERYRRKYGNIQRLDRILEAEGDSVNHYKASKQADVLMLFYLFSFEELESLFGELGYTFEPDWIPKNIEYYLKRTSNGSSLSRVIHSWVAARCDREHSWQLFREALATDVGDIQGGTTPEGIHLGAMAGCIDLIQRGYTGLETRGEVLRLKPRFPPQLSRIHLHLRYRGHWLELDVEPNRVHVEAMPSGAGPIDVEVREQRVRLEQGQSRVLEFE